MKKNSFLRFLEEKRGRKPLSPTHAQDKAFILAQNPNIKPTAMTMAIRGMKAKFMKWIEAHNKELLKNLEDDSLETLQKIITANNIQPPKVKMKQDWRIAEQKIADGIQSLLEGGFFTFIDKDGMRYPVTSDRFSCKVAGGSDKSDVVILKLKGKKAVYVECKLNFISSDYFKFGLEVVNGKLKYDHKHFLRNLSSEEKEEMDEFFLKRIDLSGFLNEILEEGPVRDSWRGFLSNLETIEENIKTDQEFREFASEVHFSKSFPNDTDLLIKVFDRYCQHYIEKYDNIIQQIYDSYEGNYRMDDADEFYIQSHAENKDWSTFFRSVDSLLDMFYVQNDAYEGLDEPTYLIDDKKIIQLSDEAKTIEVKLQRIMEKAGLTSPRQLLEMSSGDKLRYFFAAFLSTTGRKSKGKQTLITLQQDELGNMELCPEFTVENTRLAQMISDFYVKKDSCIYIQIEDRIYTLREDYNLFQIPELPCFLTCMKKFWIKLMVPDDLSSIRLLIRGIKPKDSELRKFSSLSFKESDTNYLGKKFEKLEIRAS